MAPRAQSPSRTARRWSASTAAPAYRPAGAVYRPRRPTETRLYPAVQHHLQTFLAQVQDTDPRGWGVPRWVERDFRSYLRCGILAHGFARVRCTDCGHERLMAFPCKGRGVCRSCSARRMAEVAVHLTDEVIPHLPVRQWVLSVPKRLRPFLHQTPQVASSLNPHYHYHVLALDGLVSGDIERGVQFHEATGLEARDAEALGRTVQLRVLRWFARRELLDPTTPTDMRAWRGTGGFSVDGSVRIDGADRAGLERLVRYCARGPLALERPLAPAGIGALSSPEARLVYRLPEADAHGRQALRLTPLELLERLARLVPPPRIHRHRYHGVLAPNPRLRTTVVTIGRPVPDGEGVWIAYPYFARVGLPALYTDTGVEHVERGEAWMREQRQRWKGERYHKPADVLDESWDLDGALSDLRILFAVGRWLAVGRDSPVGRRGASSARSARAPTRPTRLRDRVLPKGPAKLTCPSTGSQKAFALPASNECGRGVKGGAIHPVHRRPHSVA